MNAIVRLGGAGVLVKLGKGRIIRLGESPYKRSLTSMSFVPRHII